MPWPVMVKKLKLNGFYEDLQDVLELTLKKDVLFIIMDWNAKVGSQETPGVNRQIWPWSTEWSRAKANRVLPREHTGHSKHPLPTTQEKKIWLNLFKSIGIMIIILLKSFLFLQIWLQSIGNSVFHGQMTWCTINKSRQWHYVLSMILKIFFP